VIIARPAIPLAIAFVAGILLAGAGIRASAWLFLTASLILAAALVLRRRFPVAIILLIVLIAGWARYASYTRIADDDICHQAWKKIAGFSGVIISDPDMREDRAYVILRAERVARWSGDIPVSGRVMVTVYSDNRSRLEYGQRVFIQSIVRPPMTARNPGAFSWADYLARQRIYATASVKSNEELSVLKQGRGNPAIYGSLRAKRWLESGIGGMFPGTEAQLIKGILLGNYALLSDELVAAFGRSGTLHLLAASGLNCLVLITVFGLPLTHGLRVGKSTKSVILIALLIIYMLIIGAKPSIVRATVMASLALLAYPLRRSSDSANTLFAAALVILIIRPTDLFDVGFQLSFAAVAAIMGIVPALTSIITRAGWVPAPDKGETGVLVRAKDWTFRTFVVGAAVTLAATLGTVPLTAYYFNYASIVSPIANMTLAAAIEPLFTLGLSAPFVEGMPILSEAISFTGTQVAAASIAAVSYLGGLQWSAISSASPSWLAIAGYYIILWGITAYASTRITRK
jgi:competence protein ComEC